MIISKVILLTIIHWNKWERNKGKPDNLILVYSYCEIEGKNINKFYFVFPTMPQYNKSTFYTPIMLGL